MAHLLILLGEHEGRDETWNSVVFLPLLQPLASVATVTLVVALVLILLLAMLGAAEVIGLGEEHLCRRLRRCQECRRYQLQ